MPLLTTFVRKEGPGWGRAFTPRALAGAWLSKSWPAAVEAGAGFLLCLEGDRVGPFDKVEHALNAAARALKRCCG